MKKRTGDENALMLITYGIYLLGVVADDSVAVMVVSWVSQVSFRPRRVAVCIKKTRYCHDCVKSGGAFSLCVLEKGQQEVMARLKREKKADERTVAGLPYERGQTGAPILKDCAGFLDCRLVQAVDAGDHTIFIGDVVGEGVLGGVPLTVWDLEGHYYGG
jgi:flavin reductase (DIM6/NTAB) family NADH-FMN oxidoreductase RutF